MKKKTGILSLGLSVLMTILCISGCNSPNNDDTSKSSLTSSDPVSETASVPESFQEPLTEIDEDLPDFDYVAVDEDCIAITGYRGEGGRVEIPSTIDGMKVTYIVSMVQLVDDVEEGCGTVSILGQKDIKPITGIRIPETVQYIFQKAFNSCPDIETIEAQDSLLQIGGYAFHDTKWFEKQSDGDVYIGSVYYTYKGEIPAGTVINIKDGTRVIAEAALAFDQSKPCYYPGYYESSEAYEEEVKKYEERKNRLVGVNIPDSVEWIGRGAFYNRGEIVIPDSVKKVGHEAVSGYDDNGYKDKVYGRFRGNDNDSDDPAPLTIKGGTRCIVPTALYNYYTDIAYRIRDVSELTLPDSLCDAGFPDAGFENEDPELGFGCGFYYLPNLTAVKVGENNQYYSAVDGVLFNKDQTELIAFPKSNPIEGYKIPATVKKIGGGAFSGRKDLTSIEIPDGVTCIGNNAFDGTGLTDITIPGSVKYIGMYAFADCENLTGVKMGSNVKVI